MEFLRALNPLQADALTTGILLAVAIAAGIAVHRILYRVLRRWAGRGSSVLAAVVSRTVRPAAYIIPLAIIGIILPTVGLREQHESWRGTLEHAVVVATIAAFTWAAIAMVRLWEDLYVARCPIDAEDNLLARRSQTRVGILAQTSIILLVLVGVAIALMTFPSVRALGTTLLASAGVAGLLIGLAARPLFENLVAGIQLALTEPIRLDDVLVVQGYWGRVEEITPTYVVIRVWDLRRLVVPLSFFINNPFENWTRRTANLMGEVFLFADWTVDVEALRTEIPKILSRTKLWDGQVQNCQVTDATDRAIQLRVLVSARNSGDLWDLRCFVREGILAYLRDHQPHALPQVRFESPAFAENRVEDVRGSAIRTRSGR
jgi:small-conductance mechanosensitive channel